MYAIVCLLQVQTGSDDDEGEFEAPPTDLPFNSDVLARAVMQSMSIWRSHGDTSTATRRPARRKVGA